MNNQLKASMTIRIISWIAAVTAIVLTWVFYADVFSKISYLGDTFFEFVDYNATTNFAKLFDFANIADIWKYSKATFTIMWAIVLVGFVYAVLEIALAIRSKNGKPALSALSTIVLSAVIAFETVFFIYPGNFHASSTSRDGYGIIELISKAQKANYALGFKPYLAELPLFFLMGSLFFLLIASFVEMGGAQPKDEVVEVAAEETPAAVEETPVMALKEEVIEEPKVEETVQEEPKTEEVKDNSSTSTRFVAADGGKAKVIRLTFAEKLEKSEKSLKEIYNDIKAYACGYGLKSRISAGGDTFRLHKKCYFKINIAGKALKIYYALSPKDYKDSTIPFTDSSNKKLYADTPLTFRVKSELSIKRAKALIDDVVKADGLELKKIVAKDYASEIEQ